MKKILLICTFLTVLIFTMTSCSHEHQWSEWQPSKAATCTQDGINIRVCDDCGESQSIPVSATGHTWSAWNTTKEATCTVNGSKERSCACGEKETDTIVASHAWKDATCTEAKNCSKCGLTDGSVLGHTCSIGTCTRCNTTVHPTVNLPSTPIVAWDYSCCMKITDISYSFDSSGNLIIAFSGEKTVGSSGSYIGMSVKLLDEDGYTLYTTTWNERGLDVGDKFKNETIKIYASNLNGSSNYTIIISDF